MRVSDETGRVAGLLQTLAALACLYALGAATGFVIFAGLFKLGVWSQERVLFFRGLGLAALTFAMLFAALTCCLKQLRRPSLSARDAFGAAVISLSFNVCFLVVAPVTVDRSVSVFMLGEMAAHPDEDFSEARMSQLFVETYVGDYQQIGRRLAEQSAVGNIAAEGGTYRISPRGQRFIAISKFVSWLFDGDPRFVSPPPRPGPRLSLAAPR